MNNQLEIVNKIKHSKIEYGKILQEKLNAPTLSLERDALIRMEKKQSYIDGLSAALVIIQKK